MEEKNMKEVKKEEIKQEKKDKCCKNIWQIGLVVLLVLSLLGNGCLILELNYQFKNIDKLNKDLKTKQESVECYQNENKELIESIDNTKTIIKETIDESDVVMENDWKTFTHTKEKAKKIGMSFKGFKIYFPQNWNIEGEYMNSSISSFKMKVSKANGDYFEILQSAGGGGWCIYPDEADYETFKGMSVKYDNYFEINRIDNYVWRLSKTPIEYQWYSSYSLCELSGLNSQDRFQDTLSIGWPKINITLEESKQELIQILEKIEILE